MYLMKIAMCCVDCSDRVTNRKNIHLNPLPDTKIPNGKEPPILNSNQNQGREIRSFYVVLKDSLNKSDNSTIYKKNTKGNIFKEKQEQTLKIFQSKNENKLFECHR